MAGARIHQARGDFANEDLIETGLVAANTSVDLIDAPRDKRTYFREINYIAAAFQYQKKNYNSA